MAEQTTARTIRLESRISAAQEAGQETATEIGVIRLSREAQEKFVELLLNPPEPGPALKRAFERHRALVAE